MFSRLYCGQDERRRRHTFQLLVQSPPTCDTKCTYKLFKVDRSVFVLVEYIEDIVREFARIAEREELLIYSAELGFV